MKYLQILFVLLFFVNFGYTQNNKGFYGAKFYSSLNVLLNRPFLYNRSTYGEDKLNYGCRLDIQAIIERNVSVGFEGGVDFCSLRFSENDYYSNFFITKESVDWGGDFAYEAYYKAEIDKMSIQTYSLMPKISISSINSLVPLGLTHQIGFGLVRTKVVNNRNDVEFTKLTSGTDDILSKEFLESRLYNYYEQEHKGYVIMYALTKRYPLSKHMLLDFGLRYTLNISPNRAKYTEEYSYDGYYETNRDYFVSNYDMSKEIFRQRLRTVINFNCGVTYAF